jgi:uncharacterized linocin/CFP29 family protein
MTDSNSPVPWTEEQWVRVRQVIQEEANRARVGATFLPLYGPLPPDTDFVPFDRISYPPEKVGEEPERMKIDDTTTVPVPTLQVKVFVRGAQMSDPELTSVLQLFRRAGNVLARLEDALIFRGQTAPYKLAAGADKLPKIWDVLGGDKSSGLLPEGFKGTKSVTGNQLVEMVSDSITTLEDKGHFGPFATVLGHQFFNAAQTPSASLVLPQDRIIPFLGGGSLLRTSTLPERSGVVVALGGAPVDLVVATDVSLNFLQVTTDPMFVFRVFEKVVLRIKEPEAIVALEKS